MMRLENGREYLYQWDKYQRVILDSKEDNMELHFACPCDGEDTALSVKPYVEDDIIYADIPNILLQRHGCINIYKYIDNGDVGYTYDHFMVGVRRREKPSDYVYEEIEILSYKKLATEQLEQLKKNTDSMEKISEAVKTADTYIGDYQYRELICEFTENDFREETELVLYRQSFTDETLNYEVETAIEGTYSFSINECEPVIVEVAEGFSKKFKCGGYNVLFDACYVSIAPIIEEEEITSMKMAKINPLNETYKDIENAEDIKSELIVEFSVKAVDGSTCIATMEFDTGATFDETSYLKTAYNYFESLYEHEFWLWIGAAINFDLMEYEKTENNAQVCVKRDGDISNVDYIRFYKVNKNLGDRISEILDEINGEVI